MNSHGWHGPPKNDGLFMPCSSTAFTVGHSVPLTKSVTASLTASSPAQVYCLLRSSSSSTNFAGNHPERWLNHRVNSRGTTSAYSLKIWKIELINLCKLTLKEKKREKKKRSIANQIYRSNKDPHRSPDAKGDAGGRRTARHSDDARNRATIKKKKVEERKKDTSSEIVRIVNV